MDFDVEKDVGEENKNNVIILKSVIIIVNYTYHL